MGLEIRKAKEGWEHPKDGRGHFIPMHETFPYNQDEIEEGLRDGWLDNSPPYYGVSVVPQWDENEKTHFQLYETVSEGTPLSPPMPDAESLAKWLTSQKGIWHGTDDLTYDDWMKFILGDGWAPSMVFSPEKGLQWGIESILDK